MITGSDILKLRQDEGLSYRDISDKLNVSLFTIKKLLTIEKRRIESIEGIPERREAEHYPKIKLLSIPVPTFRPTYNWKSPWESYMKVGRTYAVSKNVLNPFHRF